MENTFARISYNLLCKHMLINLCDADDDATLNSIASLLLGNIVEMGSVCMCN